MMNRAVFLDRDGTIIRDHGYLADADKVELLPGAGKALDRLQKAGFLLVLVTNQSGVGRGFFPEDAVHNQHKRLQELLASFGVRLAGIKYCPHAPEQNCDCRKPAPGMLLKAAEELHVQLADSFMIGDKVSDIQAGRDAGCQTIAVGACTAQADYCAANLPAAVDYICSASAQNQEKRS